ncbi:MAG: hypothetical protein ACI4V3_05575, partial [Faecousia sp.]
FNLQGTSPLSRTALIYYHVRFHLSRSFFAFFRFFLRQRKEVILYIVYAAPLWQSGFFRHFAHFLSKFFEDIYKNFFMPIFFRKAIVSLRCFVYIYNMQYGVCTTVLQKHAGIPAVSLRRKRK